MNTYRVECEDGFGDFERCDVVIADEIIVALASQEFKFLPCFIDDKLTYIRMDLIHVIQFKAVGAEGALKDYAEAIANV